MSTKVIESPPDPPWFIDQHLLLRLPGQVPIRKMYYYMVNVEEHPEVLPLAYEFAATRLDAAASNHDLPSWSSTLSEVPDAVDEVASSLAQAGSRFSRPWRQATADLTRRQTLHYFTQYLPMAGIDGCWLQGGLRVSMAHTRAGASLTRLYLQQVRAPSRESQRHFVADYWDVFARIGHPLEEVSSQSFADRLDLLNPSLRLPIFFLSIAQFTRTFCAELFGVNFAWQFLGLSAFGPDLIRDTCAAYGLPALADDLAPRDYLEKGRELARNAAIELLLSSGRSPASRSGEAFLRGIRAGVSVWTDWFNRTAEAAPIGPPDPRQEMIDMLWRKAPHACGYHADRRLGSKKIDDHLMTKAFDANTLLTDLAQSPWIKPGDPNRSRLKRLIGFGGPMLAVFSPVEEQIIENWISSLDTSTRGHESPQSVSHAAATFPISAGPTIHEEDSLVGPVWTQSEFRLAGENKYRRFSVRELYHHLINQEFHSDILPVAERFARERLDKSMALLWRGERPIPSRRYDPAVLEQWVYKKHRQQLESYRRLDQRPGTSKEAFIEATVQLAPLILIDGGWLQGVASTTLIHTTVGRMLFHVLVEELGEGNPSQHHANLYRDLLTAMGEQVPQVDTWEFARWSRLNDESFEVATLWLSISCFPRHFLPEILGLNLAVELAGIGGPYMEARDTLRHFGYPSLFVDVHNAADNVSVGHSAWALRAITQYMDDMEAREGPHSLDYAWFRVWTGVRATLPQIGRIRLLLHRIARRLFGETPASVPKIFPA